MEQNTRENLIYRTDKDADFSFFAMEFASQQIQLLKHQETHFIKIQKYIYMWLTY